MRVVLDLDLCQGHGVCVEEAPDIFHLNDEGAGYGRVELLLPQPPQALRASLERAARYCPNRVITLVDD